MFGIILNQTINGLIDDDKPKCDHKSKRLTDCQTNQEFCSKCGYIFPDKTSKPSTESKE